MKMSRVIVLALLALGSVGALTMVSHDAEAGPAGMSPEKRAPLKAVLDIERESMAAWITAFHDALGAHAALGANTQTNWDAANTANNEAETLYQNHQLRKAYIQFRAAQWKLRPSMDSTSKIPNPPSLITNQLSQENDRLQRRIDAVTTLISTYGTAEGKADYQMSKDKLAASRASFAANKFAECYANLAIALDKFDEAIMSTWPESEGE